MLDAMQALSFAHTTLNTLTIKKPSKFTVTFNGWRLGKPYPLSDHSFVEHLQVRHCKANLHFTRLVYIRCWMQRQLSFACSEFTPIR